MSTVTIENEKVSSDSGLIFFILFVPLVVGLSMFLVNTMIDKTNDIANVLSSIETTKTDSHKTENKDKFGKIETYNDSKITENKFGKNK